MEEDASLFTSDTATPCDYNITNGVQNSDIFQKESQKLYHQWEFIRKVNTNTEMFLVIQTYNTMTSLMVMHSLSKQIYSITTTRITKPIVVVFFR